MGRDMYSGEPIDLHELLTTKEYDIDHIYPQSVTKDDSILNNLVLVRSSENRDKGDTYPIPAKYRQPELWTMLLNAANGKGLISKEKYDRLMRRYPLSEEELASQTDTLIPLIDDMLACRKEAIDKVNSAYGTNITVDKNSAWESKQEELDTAQEQADADVEATKADSGSDSTGGGDSE